MNILETWQRLPSYQDQFISDGIIDEKRWSGTPRKVCFLLKEAYGKRKVHEYDPAADPTEETPFWDLCQKLKWWEDRGRSPATRTWNAAADWAVISQDYPDGLQRLTQASREERSNALMSCAVINIIKGGGSNRTSHTRLKGVADRDHELVRRQIEQIEPHIIVCGYTFDYVVPRMYGERYSKPFAWIDGRLFLDFFHPGANISVHDRRADFAGRLAEAMAAEHA